MREWEQAELHEVRNILHEVCQIMNVKLGLARWVPLIARARELAGGWQRSFEEAKEMAAQACSRVADMSMPEIEKLVPGWSDSELGSEVLCAAAIRALKAGALEKP